MHLLLVVYALSVINENLLIDINIVQVDEWWEQPASTAVDWITVDGQNVAAWLAHVKQLQVAFYEKQLL